MDNQPLPFLVRFRSIGVLTVLVLLVVGATLLTPRNTFIQEANLKTLLALGPEFGIIALGVGVLMVAGEFDLSVGSQLALGSFIFISLVSADVNPYVAAVLTCVVGALIGALHGLVVVKARIVSFIATLGFMLTWRGLTEILSAGKVRSYNFAQHEAFVQVFTGRVGDIVPSQLVWFVVFAVLLFFVLQRGCFGNWIYATGDNAQAARAMAINTGLVKLACFMLVSSLCAFSAVLQTIRASAVTTHAGTGWELQAVAAAVVGGTSLRGGRGTVVGVFLGALVIMVIDNMIVQARLPYEWTYAAFGLVILGAALLDLAIEKRIQRAAA
jgi:simple sugar transport system permease protein